MMSTPIVRLSGTQAPKDQWLWKKFKIANLRKIILDDQPYRGQ